MWTAVLVISVIALLAGIVLGYVHRSLPADPDALVEQVNEALPQTQCAQCGFAGCRPYAAAIVAREAPINLCPPGGEATVRRRADLLGTEALPLAERTAAARSVAVIDESRCIGCTHCRSACPVDAIVGTQHMMHTVIVSECTGCELCVAPCPVDCIRMQALP
jgi:electron transport complex protein RnfB